MQSLSRKKSIKKVKAFNLSSQFEISKYLFDSNPQSSFRSSPKVDSKRSQSTVKPVYQKFMPKTPKPQNALMPVLRNKIQDLDIEIKNGMLKKREIRKERNKEIHSNSVRVDYEMANVPILIRGEKKHNSRYRSNPKRAKQMNHSVSKLQLS